MIKPRMMLMASACWSVFTISCRMVQTVESRLTTSDGESISLSADQADLLSDPRSLGILQELLTEDAPPAVSQKEIETYRKSAGRSHQQPNSIITMESPNVIVIVADDLPKGMLGFEGNRLAVTPNLDRMMREGVVFDQFYLPVGQCGPSRAILWSGLLPSRSGVKTNGDLFKNKDTMVLPLWLKKHGYRTGFFGKCHIGTANPGSLDVDWHFDSIYHVEGDSAEKEGQWDFYNSKVYLQKNISAKPKPGTVHLSKLIHNKALEFIKSDSQDPFFAWIAHRAPHQNSLIGSGGVTDPWPNLRPPTDGTYDVSQIPPVLDSQKGFDTLVNKPPQQKHSAARFFHGWLDKNYGIKEYHRRAYEQLHYLDLQVGQLIDELRRENVLDNTLIIFVSDNGAFLGERGLEGKGPFHYDELTRVPLVFWWPGRLSPGMRHSLVQSTDLVNTITAAAGVPAVPNTNSSNFWDVVTQVKDDRHRQSVFFQYESQQNIRSPVRGVLKSGFKFNHYLASRSYGEFGDSADSENIPLVTYSPDTFELYDMKSDPKELQNLLPYVDRQASALSTALNDPSRRPQLNDLLRTLAEFQTVSDDPEGLTIVETGVERLNGNSGRLAWRSLKSSTKAEVRASSEVVYREKDCANCRVYEVDFKSAQSNHEVTLSGLKEGVAYEVLVFSISTTGNGGFARFLLPPTVGGGQRGVGNPFLSHIWQTFATQVVEYRSPSPTPTGGCSIFGANGGSILQGELTRHLCVEDCRLRQNVNPNRSCLWNNEIFHLAATGLCVVSSHQGQEFYRDYASRAVCHQKCFEAGDPPARSCDWGAFKLN